MNPPRRVAIEIEKDASANRLFEVASAATDIPIDGMKLIFRGRIIVNKDISISEFNIEDGCVIHCMGQTSHKPDESFKVSSNMTPSASIDTAPALSARSNPNDGNAEPEHSSSTSLNALSDAIFKMKTNHSTDEFTTGLTTLSKILTNVVEKPLEDKFRRVKKVNPTFHNKFGKLVGAQDALLAVGFEINEEEYVLTPSAEAWPKLLQSKNIVDAAMIQNQRDAVHRPPIFPPTVSGVGNGMSLPGLGGNGASTGMLPPIDPSFIASMSGMFQNPAALQAMLSNPMLQQMFERDPRYANNPIARDSLRQLQSNPQMLEQVSRMMSDPQTMRQVTNMMQQSDGPFGIEGFNVGGNSRSNLFTGNVTNTNNSNAQPSASNTTSNPNSSSNGSEDLDMTEEEMIQEAIRRSMQDR